MNARHTPLTNLLHRIEEHIEQWRRQDAAYKAAAEANRERLWKEARERERLLKETVNRREGGNKPLEEVAREQGTVFVVHSEEAGKVLEEFAARGGRLVRVISGAAESLQGGAGIRGSWLVFDREG
ncbi:hypothetical protein Rxycam_01276 [Rubrobacter xylanophilus DSM 9941]|uniref:hypothetical protein n=1 Tax=Rubrobacter xylanophilus TaxID=49319 RepID=UPI001C63BFDB|nr:hypothetical protein [Rubrobacter xylanophilus]QYJ15453.1 hypothetical protein Rxycam_01276 [Rubrobacter xylanophilus DSM 9941]